MRAPILPRTTAGSLPTGVTVFERGWLSSNSILCEGRGPATLIDSGYATHAAQTLALVQHALGPRPLDLLVNTHLHSDHCGGNASLQQAYPSLETRVPAGQAALLDPWNAQALTYEATGQTCPAFTHSGVLRAGDSLLMGDQAWEIHAAPGHDPHSVILFEPGTRTLISADALWENGFGIVFPELEGEDAFDDVARTLDLIESLSPALIIPGHGRPFTDAQRALETARRRLDGFRVDPLRHVHHATKVLLKFKLLEWQHIELSELQAWAASTPYLHRLFEYQTAGAPFAEWISGLLDELVAAGAAIRTPTALQNL